MRAILFCVSVVSTGCATWATSSATLQVDKTALAPATDPSRIIVSKDDLSRPYQVLGDISAAVHKTTVFNRDPTREDVDAKLRQKAAQIGADALIFVRYGEEGASIMSWGSLEGKGRAVKFLTK